MDPQHTAELFQKLRGLDHFRVRCPECFKAYHVEISEVRETRPRFQCTGCQTRFMVLIEQALESQTTVIGIMEPKPPEAAAAANSSVSANPTNHAVTSDASGAHVTAEAPLLPVSADGSVAANWPVTVSGRVASIPADEHAPAQLTAALYACPKCGAGFKAGDEECQKCGVVFLKFAEKLNREKARGTGYKDEDSFSASKEVRYLWEDVLNDFEKLDTHQNFVSSAWADRSLDYAAHRYASILELAPQNEMAKRFLEEVRSLVHVKFEVTSDEAQKKSVFSTWLARVRLPITVQGVRWTNLVLMACGFMIVTGFFIPDMRNLVGFGSAVGFFVFALRYYFRAF